MEKNINNRIDILAFAAHPDDAEMGCAGLLLSMKDKGYRTGIVDLTRGELSSNGDLKTREKETNQASEALMLDLRKNLDMSDGNIEISMENKLKIINIIRRYKPEAIIFPYFQDRHPDHENTAKLVKEAVFLSGLVKFKTELQAYRPKVLLNYMLHYEFKPSFIVDISKYFVQKEKAVKAYASQFFSGEKSQKITHISTKAFEDVLHTRAKYFGLKIRADYGEPYFINAKIRINDPIKFFDYAIY